jgi:hypothetical protein
MNELITPGVIITILILLTMTAWLIVGRLWRNPIVDQMVSREKLFKYLDALGLVISSRGEPKTKTIYYKAYMEFLATVKFHTANELSDYNKLAIDKIDEIDADELNKHTLKLINCIRQEYKIDKRIEKLYIANLSKKTAQQ